MTFEKVDWLDARAISSAIAKAGAPEKGRIDEIIAKSLECKGLSASDVAALCRVKSDELLAPVFAAAKKVNEAVYGRRLAFFAPLHVANVCANECLYCAFRRSNSLRASRTLTREQIQSETRAILNQGHKRVLLVAGESFPGDDGFSYVLKAFEAVYNTKNERGDSIRRVSVNLAPLSVERFAELKAAGIGTYQLFQETYHRQTYELNHAAGKKKDFDWRASGMDRALRAGIEDVGIGALLGLADWRFEILAIIAHVRHLEKEFGVSCHSVSVPRIGPVVAATAARFSPYAVSDRDIKKIVAILRLAVPYTGLIMSTRESADVRNAVLELGISHVSACSRVDPGGYGGNRDENAARCRLGDHRSLAKIIRDLCERGFIPSFCTACYHAGRAGHDVLDLAASAAPRSQGGPDSLSTYLEYLLDYDPEGLETLGRIVGQSGLLGMRARDRSRGKDSPAP